MNIPAQALVGFADDTLGKVSTLGEKPQGKTYLMQNPDGRLFVKKIVGKQRAAIYEQLQTLKHPGLAETLLIKEKNGSYAVIQEYIEGETLAARLGGQKVSEADAINFICQLCLILDKIHQRGIIHRDVTPDNIIVTAEKRLALIDFGIARTYKEEQDQDTQLLGTPGYAAPEQFGFGQTSASSDIFALGVLFNVMLTGKKPHEQQVDNERLAAIIQSCTTIDPSMRYQDVLQIDYDLRQLSVPTIQSAINSTQVSSVQENTSSSTFLANKNAEEDMKGKVRRNIKIAIAVTFVCCLAALFLFVLNLTDDSPLPEDDLSTVESSVPPRGQDNAGGNEGEVSRAEIDVDQLANRWINGSGDNLERPFRGPTTHSLNLDEVEFLKDRTIMFTFNHRDGHNIEGTSIWQLSDDGTLLIAEGSTYAISIEGNLLIVTDAEGRQRLFQRAE